MIGFAILFCLFFRWGILHRVLLVVGWCWVLYSGGFLCVSSHYLILPRVSSLGSWSQCSHSKGSGIDLCSLATITLDFPKSQPRQIQINVLVIKLERRVPWSWSYTTSTLMPVLISVHLCKRIMRWELPEACYQPQDDPLSWFVFELIPVDSEEWTRWQPRPGPFLLLGLL